MNSYTVSAEQMKEIARYEMTFLDLAREAGKDDEIVFPEVYSMTLEDLYQAVRNIRDENPTVREFGEYWLYPLSQSADDFDLDRARGWKDAPVTEQYYPGIITSDGEQFLLVWRYLESVWEESGDDDFLGDAADLSGILEMLEHYFSNRGKPLEEWILTDEEKQNYLRNFDDEAFVNEAPEYQLALARKFTEELCKKNDSLALRIRGYACYGGNRLYPCDWNMSRDCMERLFEKEDDPQYANTLGYIYYYGRCNAGVPEYDRAFHYFGIAAAGGLYEGMYKLADMFYHGYGCRKSPATANHLYHLVYDDSISQFLKGKDTSFADAALRLGNIYAKGIGEPVNYEAAYHYYLQAEYAISRRMQNADYYGDSTVSRNIRRSLDETAKHLPPDYFCTSMSFAVPFLFHELCSQNYLCRLSADRSSGAAELKAERIPTKSVPEPETVLITIPQLSLCTRSLAASFVLSKDAEYRFCGEGDSVLFDACGWNRAEQRFEFYDRDELCAWVKSEKYYIFSGKEKR